jgi:hypothetical protein
MEQREVAYRRYLRAYKLREMGLSYVFMGEFLGVCALRAKQMAELGRWVALHGRQAAGVREGYLDE